MSPEYKPSYSKIAVSSQELSESDKKIIFPTRTWEMSRRVLVYQGLEGEQLASFHANVLNQYIPVVEGIPGEIEVFDYPDNKDKFIVGFRVTYTHMDQVIQLANQGLRNLAIPEIPNLPPLPDLPDWLK